jgi:hypothetical protein
MSSKRFSKRRKELSASADITASDDASNVAPLKVWPEKIIGGKYIRMLEKSLEPLRQEKSPHGSCKLFLDDVFVMYLLAFFNPTIRSLRTIEDLSQTQQAQKHLNVAKVCKSTLSDFNKLVDPDRLLPIIKALQAQQPPSQSGSQKPPSQSAADSNLRLMLEKTIAVDGTYLHAVADVAWAVANSNNHGATRHRARLDAHVNVTTWLPETIVVPAPGQSESDSAIENIQPDRIYLYDRGYVSFALIRAHYSETVDGLNSNTNGEDQHAKSHFVIRYKQAGNNCPSLQDYVEQPLTDEDREAGVTSDRIGYFMSDSANKAGVHGIKLREVVVPYEENGEPKILRIITNLLDVSAKTIALLYQYRWQVELFFRWFKSIGNFGHLLSHSRSGVLAHLYVSIIAILLTYLHTGHRPSKYMFAMLGQVAAGAATLEEVIPILRERERRKELDRQSAARRREKLKNANK